MHLLLILGIVFAFGAVAFALQNSIPVTVVIALWHYDGSLALVLLVALALGALIAGLVSTPSVIKGQWTGARLRREVASLGDERAALECRVRELEAVMAGNAPAPVPPAAEAAPYVGLKSLLLAREETQAS
jgi:uncharacterized integral membrane protein